MQLFSCGHRGAWLVLFRDKENGLCEPRYAVVAEDLCSALKLLHRDRCFLLSVVQTGSSELLQPPSFFSRGGPIGLREREGFLSLSIYLLLDWRKRLRDFQFEIRQAHAMGRNIVFSVVLRIVVPEFPHSAFPTP